MTETEILERVRIVLDQEAARIGDEHRAALTGDLPQTLDAVEAFIGRAETVAALRAAKGRTLSPENTRLLVELRDDLTRLAEQLTLAWADR